MSDFWQKVLLTVVPSLLAGIAWFGGEIQEYLFKNQITLIEHARAYGTQIERPLEQSDKQIEEALGFGGHLLDELSKLQATIEVQDVAQRVRVKIYDLRHARALLGFEREAEKLLRDGGEEKQEPAAVIGKIEQLDRIYVDAPSYMLPENSRPFRLRVKLTALRSELRKVALTAPPAIQAGLTKDLIGKGSANETPVSLLTKMQTIARAVGRVTTAGQPNGTGFLVGDGLLLTVHHVLPDKRTVAYSEIVFEADGTEEMHGSAFALDPESLYVREERLDYALAAVAPKSEAGISLGSFGAVPVDSQTQVEKIVAGEAISSIYYTSDSSKVLTWQVGNLIGFVDVYIHYDDVTFGAQSRGSGGAPIFNNRWELVGMHHSRVPRTDDMGRPIRRDGTVIAEGDDDIEWIASEGLALSAILKDLKAKATDLSPPQRQRLASLLAPPADLTHPTLLAPASSARQ